MFRQHKQILEIFLQTDIKDICTYGGYKGGYVLKITTKHLDLANSIVSYSESIGIEARIKFNDSVRIYEIYCVVEREDVYSLKPKG